MFDACEGMHVIIVAFALTEPFLNKVWGKRVNDCL